MYHLIAVIKKFMKIFLCDTPTVVVFDLHNFLLPYHVDTSMAHMAVHVGGSFDSSNTDDDDGDGAVVLGPVKKDVKGKSCISAWCNGRHSVAHPVVRINVQPKLNKHKWKQELRILLKYLRRDDDYIAGVIAAYEAASEQVLPPIGVGQKRPTSKQCEYRVHPFHFLRVVPGGGGGRASTFIPFNSLADIIAGDPVFDPSKPVFHAMLRLDVGAQMRIQDPSTWPSLQSNIPLPIASIAYVAHEASVQQKR